MCQVFLEEKWPLNLLTLVLSHMGWGFLFLLFFRSSLKNGLNNAKRTLWVSTCWPGHLHRQGSHLWTPCPPTALWMRRGCFQWCRSIWRQIWEDIWLTGEDLCNTNFKESIKVLRFFFGLHAATLCLSHGAWQLHCKITWPYICQNMDVKNT